jgi:large subunit ribosomal protein L35
MPKMKTHSGAKKRFKVTAGGKVRGRHSFTSHILEKKSPKRKRALGRPAIVAGEDTPRIKRMLGAPSGGRKPSPAPHGRRNGTAGGAK